jgi:hypothetical protein
MEETRPIEASVSQMGVQSAVQTSLVMTHTDLLIVQHLCFNSLQSWVIDLHLLQKPM